MCYSQRAWVEVDLSVISKNYDILCQVSKTKVVPVIKADAYGHGAVTLATLLSKKSVDMFAVVILDEAEELRLAGINTDILILGYTPANLAEKLSQQNIIQTVFSLEYAKELNDMAKKAGTKIRAHLKLDTGMNRIGFNPKTEMDEILQALSFENLVFEGIFTHFSCADSTDPQDICYTDKQFIDFTCAIADLKKKGFAFALKHCSNSAAMLVGNQEELDAVRAGIALYGLSPSKDVVLPEGLTPAMSLHSAISMVKEVDDGSFISYGRTYKTNGKMKIATVCAGYADGVPRLLSNKGSVLVNGKRANIVGRICMDQFLIDVTDIPDVKLGDVVTIFGKDLSVEEVAENAQTISYEILCGVSKRVPRIYK